MQGRLIVTRDEKKDQIYNFQVPLYIKSAGANSHMIQIEFVGPTTAIKAAWANLCKNREAGATHATGVGVKIAGSWESVQVVGKQKLNSVTVGDHILITGPEMGKKYRMCFVGGTLEEPSPFFMDALRRNIQLVPVLREWATELWVRGIEKGSIIPLPTYGTSLNAWQLSGKGWKEIAKEMVVSWHS